MADDVTITIQVTSEAGDTGVGASNVQLGFENVAANEGNIQTSTEDIAEDAQEPVYITPKPGYALKSIKFQGVDLEKAPDGNYYLDGTSTPLTAGTLEVVFKKRPTVDITLHVENGDTNCKVKYDGPPPSEEATQGTDKTAKVFSDEDATFTVTPGYSAESIQFNGTVLIGADGKYTLPQDKIQDAGTLIAAFEEAVGIGQDFSAGGDGASMTYKGTKSVKGSPQTFRVTKGENAVFTVAGGSGKYVTGAKFTASDGTPSNVPLTKNPDGSYMLPAGFLNEPGTVAIETGTAPKLAVKEKLNMMPQPAGTSVEYKPALNGNGEVTNVVKTDSDSFEVEFFAAPLDMVGWVGCDMSAPPGQPEAHVQNFFRDAKGHLVPGLPPSDVNVINTGIDIAVSLGVMSSDYEITTKLINVGSTFHHVVSLPDAAFEGGTCDKTSSAAIPVEVIFTPDPGHKFYGLNPLKVWNTQADGTYSASPSYYEVTYTNPDGTPLDENNLIQNGTQKPVKITIESSKVGLGLTPESFNISANAPSPFPEPIVPMPLDPDPPVYPDVPHVTGNTEPLTGDAKADKVEADLKDPNSDQYKNIEDDAEEAIHKFYSDMYNEDPEGFYDFMGYNIDDITPAPPMQATASGEPGCIMDANVGFSYTQPGPDQACLFYVMEANHNGGYDLISCGKPVVTVDGFSIATAEKFTHTLEVKDGEEYDLDTDDGKVKAHYVPVVVTASKNGGSGGGGGGCTMGFVPLALLLLAPLGFLKK
ncbi:MAG: hypothetical protein CSA35_09580 [Dethiosulfovibrio peptidovorans]|nr:MAG: hypothetical protein CSA35_09580 [Dethiosulfovibrio peptidovorans]